MLMTTRRALVPLMTRRQLSRYYATTSPTAPPPPPPVARAIITDPKTVKPPFANYSHGSEVPAGARLVYVSGQLGIHPDGTTPQCAEAQADVCLGNIRNILAAAQGQECWCC
jgi:enamine deaminase RidA (YjgF/YER057c/UK114 family)